MRQKGYELYLDGELEGAHRVFLKAAQSSERACEVKMACHWWLGRIEERWGNLEKSLAQFRTAVDILNEHPISRGSPEHDRFWTRLNRMILFGNIIQVYKYQGKRAKAFTAYKWIESISNTLHKEGYLREFDGKGPCTYALRNLREARLQEAELLYEAGRVEESLQIVRKVARYAEKWDCNRLKGTVWADLMDRLRDLGRLEEAVDYGRRIIKLPFDRQYAYKGYLRAVKHAANQAALNGATEEVWQAIDAAIARLKDPVHHSYLYRARIVRAQVLLEAGKVDQSLSEVERLIEELDQQRYKLFLADSLALKARALVALGRFDEAWECLQRALTMYRSLGLKRKEEQLETLARKIRQGKSGPTPSQTIQVTQPSASREEERAQPSRPADWGSAPPVTLQPRRLKTRVTDSENAYGLFVLYNPGRQSTKGVLRMEGEGLTFRWRRNPDSLAVRIRESGNGQRVDRDERPLELAAGGELRVIVIADSASVSSKRRVILSWDGEKHEKAEWELGNEGADTDEVVVADASLIEQNPFFAVPIYHQIYYRGTEAKLVNFRIQADAPARIEVYHGLSDGLVAIDAQGNGDFGQAGDVFVADADENGFPDIKVARERQIRFIRMRVYPRVDAGDEKQELRVRLELQRKNEWVHRATSALRLDYMEQPR